MDLDCDVDFKALRQSRRLKRSQVACMSCRRRKVRCDFAINGPPCTNCRLDGCDCVTKPRAGTRIDHTDGRHSTGTGSSPPPFAGDDHDAADQQSGAQPASFLPQQKTRMTTARSDCTCPCTCTATSDGGGHVAQLAESTPYSGSVRDKSKLPSWSHLPFSYYPFLKAHNLSRLQPQDVAYLESQRSLHVPAGPFLDSLVKHFFLYVHPCFPVVDEAEFWRMYRDDGDQSCHQFSLLLFQAMLFTAASYIPFDVAKSAGYGSIVELRKALYRRAKLLYDFGVEKDPLRIAQATLLLTYYLSNSEQLTNSTWLAVAIQQARAVNAHQYYRMPGKGRYKRSDLKRLWWCCIIRDRIIALGVRRSVQITPDDFDFSQEGLNMDDLGDEIHHSEVYDPDTKTALCKTLTSLCQLAAAVTTLVMIVYPPSGLQYSIADAPSALARCDDAKARLQFWEKNCMVRLPTREAYTHPSVTTYTHLVSLYYQSARLALCHHVTYLLRCHQSQNDHSDDEHGRLEECQPELMDAIASVTDKVKCFIMTGTAKHLPISAVAYTVLPQAFLRLNVRLSGTTADQARHERSLRCYSEISRLCNLQHGISFPTDCMHRLLRAFESSQEELLIRSSPGPGSRAGSTGGKTAMTSYSDIIYRHPAVYLRLAAILDYALSTGETFTEESMLLHFPIIGGKEFPLFRSPRPPSLIETKSSSTIKSPGLRALAMRNDGHDLSLDALTASRASSVFRFDSDQEDLSVPHEEEDEEERSRRKRQRRIEDILIQLPLFGE